MARLVLLVELTGYTAAAVSQVYRFSRGSYATWPTDTPANTPYLRRVKDPGSLSRRVSTGSKGDLTVQVGYGLVTLTNKDGALDAIFASGTVSFRERLIRVLMVAEGAAYSTAQVLISAVIAQVELSRDEVAISIKDASYLLASPHLTATFAGTNVLPAGVEGTEDLKGKVKPALYGQCLKIPAPCNNTSKLIYFVSARPLLSVEGVYVGGVALTPGATYADQAAMEATAPAAGEYRAWLAGGMVRLGASPSWAVTVDATADSAANSTAAQLIKRLALDRSWPSGDISAADVTALDTANSAVCGVWIDDDRPTVDVMTFLAQSISAAWWPDRLGQIRMARRALPSGTAADVVATWRGVSVTQVMSGQDVPVGTARLRYARYHRAQGRSELAPPPTVTDADATDLGQEWRVASYSATPSPNPHARLLTIERDTALVSKAAAEAAAQYEQALYAGPRRTHECKSVQLLAASVLLLDLGAVIALRWPRYGFSNDTDSLRLVDGLTLYLANLSCDLTLWGE